ncbi:heat shock protein transcriptional repressor HspR [Arcanobacterium pinnipediorum]|uniref:heat shock protein transcriptional repressor HspR n=1 Tax=Arcanobacterium pinnipediorum TaxID=1503041 RepID=UPI0025AE1580|nr:helix-turn-helix transcriptional regulator [Arcanobacterium pinnipediorum]
MAKVSHNAPILTVSVAAELAGMHAQTVRQYDRLGLVVAKRTRGGGRRYSLNDVERLTEIQRLSQEEGINLAGISRIFELRDELAQLANAKSVIERQLAQLRAEYTFVEEKLRSQQERQQRVIAVNSSGQVEASGSIDVLRRTLRAVREDERKRTTQTLHDSGHYDTSSALVPSPGQLDWLMELFEQHMRARIDRQSLPYLSPGEELDDDQSDIVDVHDIS